MRKPKVFLFDEPLSNLDAKLRVQMRLEIKKLHQRLQTTMIYVTHDQVEAMTMGDRIVVMNHGVVQQVDTPLRLYSQPANRFVAGFIGSPAMNFFSGSVQQKEGFHFAHPDFTIALSEFHTTLDNYSDKSVVLGIRPEHISLTNKPTNFKAELEIIEPIGSEIYLHLKTKQARFVVRTSQLMEYTIGQDIYLACDPKNMHFFDTETQKRIH